MATPYLGQWAALGAATCWAVSLLFFESALRRMSTLTVNLLRLICAALLLAAVNGLARGRILPLDATAHQWFWLGISGCVGYVFGDFCYFRAVELIGPRSAALMMALTPLFTTGIGWLVLQETLAPLDVLGMTLIVGGIAWAIAGRRPSTADSPASPRLNSKSGLLFGVGAALGQSGGLVLSKLGMQGYNAFAATQVRVLVGVTAYGLALGLLGRWPQVAADVRQRQGLGYLAAGAVFGPFLGVSLALLSLQHAVAGVASSLMSTTPILIIPLVILIRGEKVGWAGFGGAALAVGGAALLFL